MRETERLRLRRRRFLKTAKRNRRERDGLCETDREIERKRERDIARERE